MFTSLIKARQFRRRENRERGQGLIEYALILILVAIAVVVIVGSLGQTVNDKLYNDIACNMATATGDTSLSC